MSDSSRPASTMSEDELARMMIERIARQVDLETGRTPLASEDEDEPAEDAPPAGDVEEEAAAEPEADAAELSEADVSRDLVERIAREVDEESHG